MFQFVANARLFVFCVLLAPTGLRAGDLYVSTNGTPSGPGTLAQPYDLATALSGRAGQPGDTFWLTGGTYAIGHIDTKIQGAPGQPITFREVPGERARVDGSLTFWDSAGNVVLRDFELFSSDTNRVSTETNVGFNPTDITILPGIASYSPNMSFINLIVHDETRHGIYIAETNHNNLIYGCVIYNNGWRAPDNAEGHGIYAQGTTRNVSGDREIADNIVCNNSGAGLQVYENESNYLYLAGITLDGNVAFNAGAIQNVRAYRDWIVGVDAPAKSADQIVFENNLGYFPSVPGYDDAAQIGRQGINGSVAILNNYLPQGLEVNNWTNATVSGNVLAAQSTNYYMDNHMVGLDHTLAPLKAAWNGNTYLVVTNGRWFLNNSNALNFSGWQSATRFDSNSVYQVWTTIGTKIFMRTNRYEAGRANIIVYNWDNLSNVAVDVSSVLVPGEPYEVRNAEDFFAPPVLSGVFDGQPLNLPMTGLSVAVPNGPMLTPPPTSPAFNVFVLLPRLVRLQAALAAGQVLVSWPTNSGDWVLQSTPSLSAGGTWVDVTNTPALVADHEIVTNGISGSAQFFRLRPAP